MLTEVREDRIQSSRTTSFSGTGGRMLKKGMDVGKLVRS